MKVFLAALVNETNTFAPFPTTLEDFELDNPEVDKLLMAAADLFEENGWEVVRGMSRFAMPAGKVNRKAYLALKNELISQIENCEGLDAIVLQLHGAMVAQGEDDCEGDILSSIKDRTSSVTSVGIMLDAHTHLTEKMIQNIDILACNKEWPHIDGPEIAKNVANLIIKKANGEILQPCISVADCQMIAPFHTTREPVKSVVEDMLTYEREGRCLSISPVHGFPFADVKDVGAKIVVITDGAKEAGEEIAAEFADRLFKLRGNTTAKYLSLNEGLDKLENLDSTPVGVADVADVTGGGAPGDSTFILKGLLDRGIEDVLIATFWDPQATKLAIKAGKASHLQLRIGGKASRFSGACLDLEVEVLSVYKDDISTNSHRDILAGVGDIAVVKSGPITIMLMEKRYAFLSPATLRAIGLVPESFKAIVVKSANNFRGMFEDVCGEFIYITTPGLMGAKPSKSLFTKIDRSIWPLDNIQTRSAGEG